MTRSFFIGYVNMKHNCAEKSAIHALFGADYFKPGLPHILNVGLNIIRGKK